MFISFTVHQRRSWSELNQENQTKKEKVKV